MRASFLRSGVRGGAVATVLCVCCGRVASDPFSDDAKETASGASPGDEKSMRASGGGKADSGDTGGTSGKEGDGGTALGGELLESTGGDSGAETGGRGGNEPAATGGDGAGDDPFDIEEPDYSPGPEVEVTSKSPRRLHFHDARTICVLRDGGAIECRVPGGAWAPAELGAFTTAGAVDYDFYPSGEGSGTSQGFLCVLLAEGTAKCDHVPSERDGGSLCGDGDCVGEGLPANPLVRISVGDHFGCGLTSEGSLSCFGDNADGRATPPEGVFVDVAVAGDFGCAIDEHGLVHCWGAANRFGTFRTPGGEVAVSRTDTTMDACVRAIDGSLSCNGTTGLPSLVTGEEFARIAVGEGSVCALSPSGVASCYSGGPLADLEPFPGPFVDIAVQKDHACALRGDGLVECWGGELGRALETERCLPNESQLGFGGRTFELAPEIDSILWSDNHSGTRDSFLIDAIFADASFSSSFGDSFLRLGGSTPSPLDPDAATFLQSWPDRVPTLLDSGLLLFDGTGAPGSQAYCVGPGSCSRAMRNGDEVLLDWRHATAFEPCPGDPVAGTIGFEPGTIDTIAFSSTIVLTAQMEERLMATFSDDSRAFLRVSAGHAHGMYYSRIDGPMGGALYCVGDAQKDGSDWTLSALSKVRDCPSDGMDRLGGCVRQER